MVRLRKDKKSLILNEKRRKLYFEESVSVIELPELAQMN